MLFIHFISFVAFNSFFTLLSVALFKSISFVKLLLFEFISAVNVTLKCGKGNNAKILPHLNHNSAAIVIIIIHFLASQKSYTSPSFVMPHTATLITI